jgi:hypothetical protein
MIIPLKIFCQKLLISLILGWSFVFIPLLNYFECFIKLGQHFDFNLHQIPILEQTVLNDQQAASHFELDLQYHFTYNFMIMIPNFPAFIIILFI